MTEKLITRQAIQRACIDLKLAWESLDQCVQMMNRDDVPHLPLHGENYTDKLVPQVAKWATKLEGQVKMGISNYLDGLQSLKEETASAKAPAKAPAKGRSKAKKGSSARGED